MTRTNGQVKVFVSKMLDKYGEGTEKFYTALLSYWVRYELTDEQCAYLEAVKSGQYGPERSLK